MLACLDVQIKFRFPDKYIDSEFAYQWPYIDKKEKKHTTIRIDLVELREKTLVFTELKLITDSRLTSRKGEAEIISQMGAYANFIKKYVEELKNYYAQLLRIKKRLGLWKGETDIESVSLTPELLIVNTYKKDEMSEGKDKRIDAIKDLKEKRTFDTSIVDYPDLCE